VSIINERGAPRPHSVRGERGVSRGRARSRRFPCACAAAGGGGLADVSAVYATYVVVVVVDDNIILYNNIYNNTRFIVTVPRSLIEYCNVPHQKRKNYMYIPYLYNNKIKSLVIHKRGESYCRWNTYT